MVFIAGYFIDFLFFLGKLISFLLILFFILDVYLLFFTRQKLLIVRELPDKFSNGDENTVFVFLKNNYFFNLVVRIIDEIPFQFQQRNFSIPAFIPARNEKKIQYTLKPFERGAYGFGKIYAFIHSPIGLIQRRFSGNVDAANIKVYPSYLRMHQYQLLAISDRLNELGITRVRKIGLHSEFDQIRDYVTGDDYRTINWKATARKDKLMVNQYQDERSQQIYSIIDMGRTMQMPFEKMSLLDYAINAALIISNIAVQKHDKAGIITFNTSINSFMPAERKNNTILKILELLYDQKTLFAESNTEILFTTIKRKITHRSFLIIYTNFESLSSLNRQMEFLIRLTRSHLVLLIMFENTEIRHLLEKNARTLEDIYISTIAEKFIYEKKLIVKELNLHGIHSILTKPQNLTVNLINKYLEMKARGLI